MPGLLGPSPLFAMEGVDCPPWGWKVELYYADGIWIADGVGDEAAAAESAMHGTVGRDFRRVRW